MRSHALGRGGVALALVAAAAGLGACAKSDRGPVQTEPASGRSPHAHGVFSDRLRAIMTEVERAARTAWPQEVDAESSATASQRAAALTRMAGPAAGLEAAAGKLPDAVAHVRLSQADRRAFEALAATLGEQTGTLRARIDAGDLDGARETLTHINATCISCHERFRDVSGPMLDTGPQHAAVPRRSPTACVSRTFLDRLPSREEALSR
ncbi:MAG: cytochrome c [Phycisphaerae bacterium]|nr:cytochrome c [Planctomycetia bacterium]MCK6463937.1 cytochrome c [Phycisphaerae bacterium]MCL4718151.1 cytochrome c [Phycisphaerae bacterium]NUQ09782.1 cytochrome c [Phycisphaerae bacterium]